MVQSSKHSDILQKDSAGSGFLTLALDPGCVVSPLHLKSRVRLNRLPNNNLWVTGAASAAMCVKAGRRVPHCKAVSLLSLLPDPLTPAQAS